MPAYHFLGMVFPNRFNRVYISENIIRNTLFSMIPYGRALIAISFSDLQGKFLKNFSFFSGCFNAIIFLIVNIYFFRFNGAVEKHSPQFPTLLRSLFVLLTKRFLLSHNHIFDVVLKKIFSIKTNNKLYGKSLLLIEEKENIGFC